MKTKQIEGLPKGAIMAFEVAESELEKWFDYRKTKESRRNVIDEDLGYDMSRKKLIEAFQYGELIFDNETGILKQVLQYPVKKESGDIVLSEIGFKPRVQRRELIEPMKGVKATDMEGKSKAWISACTGTNKGFIGSLDLSDYSLSESIIMYFLT